MRLPIFYYHSVGGPPPQTLALSRFREHLAHIRRHGFEAVTVAEWLARPRPRCVALAFDDGLLDNYENVLPLLLEHGMRATFYVVPGYSNERRWVNPSSGRWSDVPLAGYTQEFHSMGRRERQELAAHGMELGSHSLTHRRLTRVPRGELRAEIAGSKAWLEDELGRPVTTFCYPLGRFSGPILRMVRSAGYRAACSTLPGYCHPSSYPFLLPRFLVQSPSYFEQVLLGRPWRLDRLLWA